MQVRLSDEITRPWRTYLQSVNGYFRSRYAKYSPWNAMYLYVLGRTEFFLIAMHFLQVFNANDKRSDTLDL